MTGNTITRISLDELNAKAQRGELIPDSPDAQPGPDLGPEFWEHAIVVNYNDPTSVHLKLDPYVFAWFKSQGKGHLTRMQDVLKAYALAQSRKAQKPDATKAAE